jgi:hypothetical protein
MPDYKDGKIYKIMCNVTGKIYIGSTTHSLRMCLAEHRSGYKQYMKKMKGNYVTSYQIIEQGNYDIELVERMEYESKEELLRRERHFIEIIECVNKVIPTRTHKEYYEDNKMQIADKRKEYVKKRNQHKICRPNREEYKNYLRLQILEQKKQLDINMIKIDKIFGCK